ncbi:cysteine protease, partial [Pseudomonas sp. MWU13-2860]
YHFELSSPRPLIWRGEKLDGFQVAAGADGKSIAVDQKGERYLNFTNEWDNSAIRSWQRLSIATSDQPQQHFGSYAARYNEILAASLPPAAAAVVAAQQGKPAAQQVATFMQHINSHYRYLNDQRLAERGLVPFTLAEIEQHGYGDCKDLATLLAAMLRASGIAAEPTLVFR